MKTKLKVGIWHLKMEKKLKVAREGRKREYVVENEADTIAHV